MPDREYKQPGIVRQYAPDEGGAGIAGYMHHLSALLQGFRDALGHAAERMTPPAPSPYGPPIDVEIRQRAEQWLPAISIWEPELIRSAAQLGLESELNPLLAAVRTAIGEMEPAAVKFEEQRSRYFADRREPHRRGKRRNQHRSRHPDLRAIRRRLSAAEAVADQIASYWVRFDPAKPRVDQAAVPWEKFREVAVDVDYAIYETVTGRKPESYERNQEVEKHRRIFDEDLYGLRDRAVRYALNHDLGTKINDACQRVLDAGRESLREAGSATAFQGDWIQRWNTLNDAAVRLQDVEALFRRGVRETRRTQQAEPPKQTPPAPTSPRRHRIVLDPSAETATLEGTTWALTADRYVVLKAILDGKGQWVGRKQIQDIRWIARPDRIMRNLPPPIRVLIETKEGPGGGSRIDPSRIDTIGPS